MTAPGASAPGLSLFTPNGYNPRTCMLSHEQTTNTSLTTLADLRFKNPKSARDFLRDHGIRKPEKEGIQIIPQSEAALEPAV